MRWRSKRRCFAGALLAATAVLGGCGTVATRSAALPEKVAVEPRDLAVPARAAVVRAYPGPVVAGDEIIVAGRRFHTGTRVVTWQEPDGHNAYTGTAPPSPRVGLEKSRNDLGALQRGVDQFVLHYDGAGLSRVCFTVLQQRKLSVHFLLDIDGTVYQTLDLQDRAAHATIANDRSIGIEIANIGAYPPAEAKLLDEWYRKKRGATVITVPPRFRNTGIRTSGFTGRPARPGTVRGALAGRPLVQYDYTPEQYAALIKLTAALCRVFPRLCDDYPHDARGRLVTQQLSEPAWKNFQGVLGHFHVQGNKIDPGPAFQWNTLMDGVRAELK